MEKKQINFYCDESCHLENDHKRYMLLGLVECKKSAVKDINEKLKEIKIKNGISEHIEVKWNKISPAHIQLYIDLINYFFDTDDLSFKTIIIDKTKLDHKKFKQTHNEFYYKMYYILFNNSIHPNCLNKFFVDEKDTKNSVRIEKLQECLYHSNYDYDHKIIAPLQLVKSHLIPMMQLVDILLGAVSYYKNMKKQSDEKMKLIKLIQKRSGYNLEKSTYPSEPKFNIFYFEGKNDV